MSSSVTCLGKIFATEDERRSYFRDALLEKLPELRKIEGFPLGDSDDILNLSDPPYYTACPNPWLNDFIDQWKDEKSALEKTSIRKLDFEVHEPYASDVSEGKNNPIYSAHNYHTKVPHPAIMRYILHYTQPGDIVFDGFAGTGMTGVAAQLCGHPDPVLKFQIETEFRHMGLSAPVFGPRNAIVGDLSPIASFIAYNYNTPVKTIHFDEVTRTILSEVEAECGWMYVTKHTNGVECRVNYTVWSDVFICPSCGGEIIFSKAAADKDNNSLKKQFKCPGCNSTQTKRSVDKAKITLFDSKLKKTIIQSKSVPVLIDYVYQGKNFQKSLDAEDYSLIQKIEFTDIPYWFPTERMPEGDESRRNDKAGITHVHHFYSKRALYTLSCLYSKAKKYTKIGEGFAEFFIEQATLGMAKISRYVPTHYSQVNQYLSGTLYIGSQIVDVSPEYILKGKAKRLPKALSMIRKRQILSVQSAENYHSIPDCSIDYIFTDPPFGANLMYSELNFLWESWLRVFTNNKSEAIENSSQGKSLLEYHDIMFKCFAEYNRILKTGKWMTVEFSNTSAAVWNGIQTALQRAGFIIANVAALDKQQGSFKAITTPTAVKQDLVISCYKPTHEFDILFKSESSDMSLWSFVEQHLNHLPISIIKEKRTTAVIERNPKILYDRMITFFFMRGLPIQIDASEFQAELKRKFVEIDGLIFTSDQATQYHAHKNEQSIPQQPSLFLDIIYSENDAVEWLKSKLAEGPKKYQDIQPDFRKANTANRRGEKVLELQTLLQENFIPLADGCWRLPDMNEAIDRDHFRITSQLKEFDKYIEELANPKVKKLKDVRVDALRTGFKSCWEKKDFATIVLVADKIPQNLLMEDEQLLMFFDIAKDRV